MRQSLRDSIIVIFSAAIVSTFTLWLVESWLKYAFFLFEILAIVLVYLVVEGYDVKLTLSHRRSWRPPVGLMLDIFLLISASTLLAIDILGIEGGYLQVVLSLLCTSILSGYALMNVLGLTQYFSKLENVVMSFVISYAFAGFLTLGLLPLSSDLRILIILCSYIAMGLLSVAAHARNGVPSAARSLSKNIDLFSLMLVLAFYVLSFCAIYPRFALIPGTDASQHYANSVVLWRTPDLLISLNYLFALLHEATLISLSSASVTSLQAALVTLNLIMPLAFYAMSHKYLERIDRRLPSLATLFWVLFTNGLGGFAWLTSALLKVLAVGLTEFQLLDITGYMSYNGTSVGILGLWYVPVTVSFTILMATILLLAKKEIPRSKYIPLFAVLIAASYLTHITEAAVFVVFLAIYGIVSRNREILIEESLVASIIGIVITFIPYFIFSLFSIRLATSLYQLFLPAAIVLVLFFSLLFRRFVRPRMRILRLSLARLSRQISKSYSFKAILVSIPLYLYTVAALAWLSLLGTFNTPQVDAVGLVPWFMYPMVIGINALLGLLGFFFLTKQNYWKSFAFFMSFMMFAFIAGRVVSLINLSLFQTGYTEKRFIWFLKIPLALLAPIPLLYIIGKLKSKHNRTSTRTFVTVSLIGVIMLSGFSTSVLNVEYWNYMSSNPANLPSSAELEAINSLAAMIDKDPRSWLATVTGTSAAFGIFARPPDLLVLRQLLSTAKTPEMTFTQLYRHPAYSHPYIYIAGRDAKSLSEYADSVLANYLNFVPECFRNFEVTIYNSSKPSFPEDDSVSALILPFDNFLTNQQLLGGYYMLSSGSKSYTVGYDAEDWILHSKTLILGFDPPTNNVSRTEFHSSFDQGMVEWQTVSGLWRTENGSLFAGSENDLTEGIALSPAISQEINSSFTVRLDKTSSAVGTRVSLVYSFNDEQHFRMVTFIFNLDGFIYVLTSSVDGTDWRYGKNDPIWPGRNTTMGWSLGDSYMVNVSIGRNFTKVLIDTQEVLKLNSTNPAGRVGLAYNGSSLISMDDFALSGSMPVELRPITDYVQFAASGGTVVILNTNGYEQVANRMLAMQNDSILTNLIEGSNTRVVLPIQIPAKLLLPSDSNMEIVANYTSLSGELSPFIIRQQIGNGSMQYVNIYPILQAVRDNATPIFAALGDLLVFIDLPSMADHIIPADGYFKVATLNSASGTTDSLLFPLWIEIKSMDLKTGDASQHFDNVTSLYLNGAKLFFNCEEMRMMAGKGLYSVFRVNSTLSITSPTQGLALRIRGAQGDYSFESVDEVDIASQEGGIVILARTPRIEAKRAVISELYSLGDLNLRTGASGQDLEVVGQIALDIRISDTYSLLQDVRIIGSWKLIPPLSKYDESVTFPTAYFYVLLLLPFAVILMVSIKNKEKGTRQVSTTNR